MGKLVKGSWTHCGYFHIHGGVLTFGKPHKIAGSSLFHDLLSIVVQAEDKNNNCSAQAAVLGNAAPDWILYPSIFVLYCFCLAEQYIIWSLAIRGDCLTQYAI